MPTVLIIAGPNGARKTSFAKSWLPGRDEDFIFVNADEIARQLSVPVGRACDLAAGREMIRRLEDLSLRGENLLVETTLSETTLASKVIAEIVEALTVFDPTMVP